MATPVVIRYPLDTTGKNPNNFIGREEHVLDTTLKVRVIAPDYGAYYTESLKIYDVENARYLTRGVDYDPAHLYDFPTQRYSKEICALIVIKNRNAGPTVLLDYQTLGGEYYSSVTAIQQLIATLNTDDRPVEYPNITGLPNSFPSASHYHSISDTYGWEYIAHALERLRQGLAYGDVAANEAAYFYIDWIKAAMEALISSQQDALNAHKNDNGNPHEVTATQLRVYLITEVDKLLSDLRTALTKSLNEHLSDKNNPHEVNAAQLKVYLKTEVDELLNVIRKSINDHLADKQNPHRVDANQVGLGLVPNYAAAADADNVAGLAKDKLVTPYGMKLYREGYMTISTVDPTSTAGFREGHMWYKI